jgi:hypothetical protein
MFMRREIVLKATPGSTPQIQPELPMEILDFDSVSDVDLEPLNGGSRETDWRDARKIRAVRDSGETLLKAIPVLEDGAD